MSETIQPIPMLLFCPRCDMQHVDRPEPENGWDNPIHRSHQCKRCGYVWRPCDVPTTGVLNIATKGQKDQDAHPFAAKTTGWKA